jgi:hypothetical protein
MSKQNNEWTVMPKLFYLLLLADMKHVAFKTWSTVITGTDRLLYWPRGPPTSVIMVLTITITMITITKTEKMMMITTILGLFASFLSCRLHSSVM